jgi:hypothetical protein
LDELVKLRLNVLKTLAAARPCLVASTGQAAFRFRESTGLFEHSMPVLLPLHVIGFLKQQKRRID